jgi:hydrogenase expression/formation protein HypE
METIKLSHGSGRGQEQLLHEAIIPALIINPSLTLEDAAVLNFPAGKLAFTTDSFVVQPLQFNGGNIGKLAACGTLNDLAMMGAIPRAISVALILEEGLEVSLLRIILAALRAECDAAGVPIVCGDTKVVERGKADGMFITTSGIGFVPAGRSLSAAQARPGDAVLVSGPIGLHGIAVLAGRKGLAFASAAVSDCANLSPLVERLLAAVPDVRTLRDATRGGCAAVLNEIARAANVTISLDAQAVPVPDVVKGACAYLGLDPLEIANEGRFVAVVPTVMQDRALAALRAHALGKGAAVIGRVETVGRFPVVARTVVGGTRLVDVPAGEVLPRIC